MSEANEGTNRREFIETLGLIGAAGAVGAMVTGCNSVDEKYANYAYPPSPAHRSR